MKHNNVIPNVHQRKHWQKYVRTWFNQPARKRRRLVHRKEKATALFPRPAEALRPVVRGQTIRYNSKVKTGRGFTLQEIKEAGLGVTFARSIGIAVDHRRRNKSQESLELNKRRLQAYVSKLILFPKKADKPKKGLVNDSTKETLEKVVAQQKKERVVMGLTPYVVSRVKAVGAKAFEDFKKEKVYRRLRQERTNQKHEGKRQKKAKEASNQR
ncbi:ribosomal protein L13e [Candidatus Dependentiae bacterium]|nr:ribosomal protein L13e [Candidatus Dependentiae bacterium]